jgi:putative multiple sugar transport system ATP-binding protein
VPLLSIAENIFLGNERARGGVIDWRETNRRTAELLRKVGLNEAPTTPVGDLGVGKQQLVEIAKALSKNVRLLILDEPTAALQENDAATLLGLLLELKAQGVTSIIISHKLNEVRRVADRVTVIRDGATVSTLDARQGQVTEDRIVRDMVGRDMAHRYPERARNPGAVLMEVEGWSARHPEHMDRDFLRGISFSVRRGEIVGIAGLMAPGGPSLPCRSSGGPGGATSAGGCGWTGGGGRVHGPQALAAGLAYVTEDRKALGLVLDEPIQWNVSLANLPGVSKGGRARPAAEERVAQGYRKAMNIRTPNVVQRVVNLSGGNQQKVLLSKLLFTEPRVLILDEPTRARRGRQVRDLRDHEPARRRGAGRGDDIVRDARAPGDVRPHLRDGRGGLRGRAAGRGGEPGADHVADRARAREAGGRGGPCLTRAAPSLGRAAPWLTLAERTSAREAAVADLGRESTSEGGPRG